MDRYLKEVGDRIRQARLKKGINQAQLAEIIDKTPPYPVRGDDKVCPGRLVGGIAVGNRNAGVLLAVFAIKLPGKPLAKLDVDLLRLLRLL